MNSLFRNDWEFAVYGFAMFTKILFAGFRKQSVKKKRRFLK